MIIISGRPVPKKNNPRVFSICPKGCPGQQANLIIKRTGRKPYRPSVRFLQSEAFTTYEQSTLKQLLNWANIQFTQNVNMQAQYWLPDKAHWPDLFGLLQGTADILEKAGILKNDRIVKTVNGSEIMGIDKASPRVEITITPLEEG